jgi:hypothetical protein
MRPQHLDEAADAFRGTAAGPGLARLAKPGIEAPSVVPIGDRDDIGEAGLIDILRAVPMRGPIVDGKARRDLRQRVDRCGRRLAAILHPEIGHDHARDRGLVARDKRRIRRRVVVGHAPVTGPHRLQMGWNS